MRTEISPFWRRWMLLIALILILMGLMTSFTPLIQNSTGAIYYNQFFDFDAYANISTGDLRFQTFLYGVMGAVLTSWGLLLAFLIAFPLRQGQKWAWYAITLSILVWFVGDGYASVSTGFAIHALINVPVLVLMGIPLLATYRQLH